jgi:RNA polymerase sigma factor (sigma-70 family)
MDVRPGGAQAPDATPTAHTPGLLEPAQVGRILMERQRGELLIARGFTECRGLSPEQLEDLYQRTSIALLHRPYQDEKHVLDALRRGIKDRAKNLCRDERRRREILADSAPGLHALERARSAEEDPEQVALARQDRMVITEFMAELTSEEREVFWLFTEGAGYNRIAKSLAIPVNQARNTLAACERKRERFQVLHDSGRLCGYRAATIKGLLEGRATSEQLAQLAAAHVQACARCRAEHHTNAQRLRRAFEKQAAALLPPVLLERAGRLGWATQHTRTLAQRLQPRWVSFGQGGVRERAAALLAGGGASTKLAATILTTAVIAGSTIAATHTLTHHPRRPHARVPAHPAALAPAPHSVDFAHPELAGIAARHPRVTAPARQRQSPGHVVSTAHHAPRYTREPGGFAYLGVPDTKAPVTATSAAVRSAGPTPTATPAGGAFSP